MSLRSPFDETCLSWNSVLQTVKLGSIANYRYVGINYSTILAIKNRVLYTINITIYEMLVQLMIKQKEYWQLFMIITQAR